MIDLWWKVMEHVWTSTFRQSTWWGFWYTLEIRHDLTWLNMRVLTINLMRIGMDLDFHWRFKADCDNHQSLSPNLKYCTPNAWAILRPKMNTSNTKLNMVCKGVFIVRGMGLLMILLRLLGRCDLWGFDDRNCMDMEGLIKMIIRRAGCQERSLGQRWILNLELYMYSIIYVIIYIYIYIFMCIYKYICIYLYIYIYICVCVCPW